MAGNRAFFENKNSSSDDKNQDDMLTRLLFSDESVPSVADLLADDLDGIYFREADKAEIDSSSPIQILVNNLKKIGSDYLEKYPKRISGYTDQISARDLAELQEVDDWYDPLLVLCQVLRIVRRTSQSAHIILEIERELLIYKSGLEKHLVFKDINHKERVLKGLKNYIKEKDKSNEYKFNLSMNDSDEKIDDLTYRALEPNVSELFRQIEANHPPMIAHNTGSTLPALPFLFFGEDHDDDVTDRVLTKLCFKLSEKGYKRFYEEIYFGLTVEQCRSMYAKWPFGGGEWSSRLLLLDKMIESKIEFRGIDLPKFSIKGGPEEDIAIIPERDEYMAWHIIKAANVPTVARTGLRHMEGIQRVLLEQEELSFSEISDKYLFVHLTSKDDDKINKIMSIDKISYPLSEPLTLRISNPKEEEDAIQIILQNIEKCREALANHLAKRNQQGEQKAEQIAFRR